MKVGADDADWIDDFRLRRLHGGVISKEDTAELRIRTARLRGQIDLTKRSGNASKNSTSSGKAGDLVCMIPSGKSGAAFVRWLRSGIELNIFQCFSELGRIFGSATLSNSTNETTSRRWLTLTPRQLSQQAPMILTDRR